MLTKKCLTVFWQRKQFTNYVFFYSRGLLVMERICSSRNKFFPLRVDPISKSSLIQRSKQEFVQTNMSLFSKKRKGLFIRPYYFCGFPKLKKKKKNAIIWLRQSRISQWTNNMVINMVLETCLSLHWTMKNPNGGLFNFLQEKEGHDGPGSLT